MQKKKDEIRDAILSEARQEFIAKGYQKASLRNIASRANITHTNIYHYYKNKDALYRAVLQPVITGIKQGLAELFSRESGDEHHGLEDHLDLLSVPVRFVSRNRDLLNLLIFHSAGSSLSSFRDDMVDELTEGYKVLVQNMNRRHGDPKVEISNFFLHNLASIWINFATECLMHNIGETEMLHSARMMMAFVFQGWCGFYEVGCGHQ